MLGLFPVGFVDASVVFHIEGYGFFVPLLVYAVDEELGYGVDAHILWHIVQIDGSRIRQYLYFLLWVAQTGH